MLGIGLGIWLDIVSGLNLVLELGLGLRLNIIMGLGLWLVLNQDWG